MKFLRMRPGYGEQLIAEGDVEVSEDEQRLVAEFRRQLEQGMWAAVPVETETGRREAEMVTAFEQIPQATDRPWRHEAGPVPPSRRSPSRPGPAPRNWVWATAWAS